MRRIACTVGVVLALLLLAVLSLPFLISANQFKPALESKLSDALGRRVIIGNIGLSVLAGGVTADSLSIAEDPAFGSSPFLQAKSLKLNVELWPLVFSRKLNVVGLAIDRPQVALLQSASGRWNYSSLGAGGGQASPPAREPAGKGTLALTAKLVKINEGRFSIGRTGRHQKPLTLDSVNVEVRDFSPTAPFTFSLGATIAGGGKLRLGGKAGPIDVSDAELTPVNFTLEVARLNLASALGGTSPDIAGLASLNASGDSNGGELSANGKATVEGLKLAKNGTPARRAAEFEFATRHDLRKHAGVLRRGDIRIGAAVASLTGTYAERGDATVLDTKFSGTKMPVQELSDFLPPLGIALPNGSRLEGGTATATFTVGGPADHLVADGLLSLEKTRLANFDLGTKMTVIEKLAGIKSGPNTDIEIFSAKLKYTPQGTVVEDLQFIARDIGELKGAGTVSSDNALDFKMNATVQTARSAALSRTALPFFVQGTAMNPIFKPDIRNLAKTEANTLLQSEASKRFKGSAGEAVGGILNSVLGRKKK